MQSPMTVSQYVSQLRTIPGDRFTMGHTRGFNYDFRICKEEVPAHLVDISTFRMGATPVTVGMWREYLKANNSLYLPYGSTQIDNHPVVNVSWHDIMGLDGQGGYCAWASNIAGFRLTLPTEAQWEFAARGGKDDQEFPWGNYFDDSKLWCPMETDCSQTAPVTRSSNIYENAFGLTDMVGNVWQWCSDLYGPYSSSSQTDPVGPPSTSDNDRCVRGGSWYFFNPYFFRCANRFRFNPSNSSNNFNFNFGFRLAAESE